jgi:hypothetical protein
MRCAVYRLLPVSMSRIAGESTERDPENEWKFIGRGTIEAFFAHFLLTSDSHLPSARLTMAKTMHPLLNFLVFMVTLCIANGFCQTRLGKRINRLGLFEQNDPSQNPSQNIAKAFLSPAVIGPSADTKPDYERIVGPLGKTVDNVFLKVFRGKLVRRYWWSIWHCIFDNLSLLPLSLSRRN